MVNLNKNQNKILISIRSHFKENTGVIKYHTKSNC
ncbi:hypothetical protein ATCC9714_PCS200511 (plasmid) [[Clostridium] sordellii]|uniref:Uncharacterized protein n=1 Tax=Paraclostridium sordellii TaxID=1505 RepID=A0ABP1XWK7_PARSO|nr:hypothetical protein ATCC9714_PCS200511 (plasmid) [[Clostridium] sordellii] [Paeniclostridium sordellii]